MSNTSDPMELLFPGARRRVLAVLLAQPGDSLHLRELARMAGSHAGTLGRELEKLVSAGLVLRSERGNLVEYRANTACPVFDDLAAMFRKTHGVAELLRQALQPLGEKVRLAVLFGSLAKGTQTVGSDVDLLVVGAVGFADLVRLLHPLQEILKREVNPVLYSEDEFRVRLGRGEGFVRNVTMNPIVFLKGDADDLAELAEDPPPAGTRGGRARGAKAARRGTP